MNGPPLRFFAASAFALLLAYPLSGQKGGGQPPAQPPSTGPVGPSSVPTLNRPSIPQTQAPPFVYGSILTGNGAPLPDTASVELHCGVQLVRAVHPDLKGHFEFNLQGGPQSDEDMSASVNQNTEQTINPMGAQAPIVGRASSGQSLEDCELRVSAPGYQPLSKVLMLRTAEVGGVNVGELILAPLAGATGAEVSVNLLLVPANARKEFEKGEDDIRHNKLPSATRHLQKAVAEYDRFAPAWDDLGRIYFTNHQNDEAGQAYSKAIAADAKFVPSYVNLAQLQYQEGQYEQAVDTAGKALGLSPGLVPASYIQAAADLRLNNLDAAEKSARIAERGPHQDIPQVPLLLADILLAKRDYAGAAGEMQSYLKDYPQGQFAAAVRSRLPEIEKLAAGAGAQPPAPEGQPRPVPESPASPPVHPNYPDLTVYLRTLDGSPFVGSANIRVALGNGVAITAAAAGSDGGVTFRNLAPGTYSVEASAPGFLTIQKQTTIEAGSRVYDLFIDMTPVLASDVTPVLAPDIAMPHSIPTAADSLNSNSARWIPADVDASVPPVEAGVACSLPQVLHGASRRMSEFVQNLQKFDATERLEQLSAARTGALGNRQTRTFDYVAVVNRSKAGAFTVDEYRNGSVDPAEFPDQIATDGLPAMALLLHPDLISGFNFACEGLGQWAGHPAWQVHFAQRSDQANRMRVYVIAHNYYPVPLKGRVWIDAATYQIRRLESDLIRPLPQIALTREHMSIGYGPVEFHKGTRQLWLPLDAEIYWERQGRRFYRHHTFSSFRLFEVGFAQEIDPPRESYCFKNTGNQDIAGVLTVSPTSGISAKPVMIGFTIPTGHSVCKLVGPGKDISISASDVGSAVFQHDGPVGSITAYATLLNGSTLDLVPVSSVAPVTR